MRTLTDEEKTEVSNKNLYIKQKAKLLHTYKSYAQDLEYVQNNYDKGFIVEKREKLALQIKTLGAKIREIETIEAE
jgi:ribosome-binding protein aMBF1 (putative translation factor)